MDKELIKAKLLGMEKVLIEYNKIGTELEELSKTLTDEEKQMLEDDAEIDGIMDRLDVLHEQMLNY